MDAARAGAEGIAGRFDGLHADAKAALTYSANTLRAVRDRYRELYGDELATWQRLRDDLDASDRRPFEDGHADLTVTADPAAAAEAGAETILRRTLRADVDDGAGAIARHQAELARLELAVRSLEATWLFLERGDATLITSGAADDAGTTTQMRIVEAQEAERARLAQEVHDGPAQSLSNAIFQVEYIERILTQDPRLAATELRFLRELLRRELGDVRNFISQLRPPVLDELGLEGALRDAVSNAGAVTGIDVRAELAAPSERLLEAEQTVVLRIVQEALQNVRKHAAASTVTVVTAIDAEDWVLEIRDDGQGFDVGGVVARGRRNFGLQFMRERAELIGARLDVRSRPDGGTIVRLAIPMAAEESE